MQKREKNSAFGQLADDQTSHTSGVLSNSKLRSTETTLAKNNGELSC